MISWFYWRALMKIDEWLKKLDTTESVGFYCITYSNSMKIYTQAVHKIFLMSIYLFRKAASSNRNLYRSNLSNYTPAEGTSNRWTILIDRLSLRLKYSLSFYIRHYFLSTFFILFYYICFFFCIKGSVPCPEDYRLN